MYAGQKQQLELDMEQWTGSKLGKSMSRLYIVTLLFNLYAEYIMWNARLDEAQAGIKIARRNINNLRYAEDITFTSRKQRGTKELLMKVNEERGKVGLKLHVQKTKMMASGPITSWEIDGETVKTVSDFIFSGSKITAAMKLKDFYFLEEKLWPT